MRPSQIPASLAFAAAFAAATTSLSAQAGAGITQGPAPSAAFKGMAPWGIHCYEYATTKKGVFTCAVASGSPSAGFNVMIGLYDQAKGTFTPTNEAAALNKKGAFNVSLTLEPEHGRYAIFIRGDQKGPTGVWFASRAKPGTAFGSPALITGMKPARGYALGYVRGKLKLFYTFGASGPETTVVMRDLTVSAKGVPSLSGTAVTVSKLGKSAVEYYDVTTITGTAGEVIGLVLSEWFNAGGRNSRHRLTLKAGLDPNRAAMPLEMPNPNCTQTACHALRGSMAGGRCIFNGSRNGPPAMFDLKAAWLLAGRAKIGTTFEVIAATPSKANSALTHVYLSIGEAAPVAFPSMFGSYALTSPLIYLGTMKHSGLDQRGRLSMQVPNTPNLRGTKVVLQGLSVDLVTSTAAFTNTSWLVVE